MAGLHECPHCHYRFEDADSLDRHLNEGRGCPETSERVSLAERVARAQARSDTDPTWRTDYS